MKQIITLENVSLTKQGKNILKNLNWQVQKGENWAILGLNGSGKSSLLRLLMAEYWKTEGKVTVLGTEFGAGGIPQLRSRIGVVGSFIAERLPSRLLTEEIVLTGKYKSSMLYRQYGRTELEEAREMLASVGGQELIGRTYASLSQGEKQLLLIARSLMEEPELLILDEASSGLDLFARERLLDQIESIARLKKAPTILYVTHHAEEITPVMDHLLLLKGGEITAQGPTETVLTKETLDLFYPQPVRLIDLGSGRFFVQREERD
ncbi:ABC transporter ATP binding protein [Streptococcus sp. DD11]|uniref:ABC transporter ATP-binding protein n=1 Tax=Streptococcus sp. DD11 TaxID=1777879 RepID=UPI00079B6F15|nr:ABC transporter ATP-binding protein [Streptococcus sp. DD11]KXT84646.1 ABC transporter ATP binding protein [Streptococcus sp. DD11]